MSDDELLRLARPRVRADCKDAARPCPWVSCRHHLADAHTGETGRLHLRVLTGALEVDADSNAVEAFTDAAAEAITNMAESCALDITDREPDGSTLEIVGNALGVTRERVRQIERRTLPLAARSVRRALGDRRRA